MRKLPILRALQSFEAVAEFPSFSAAAESLGMTHGAISHQMRALEVWFGRSLFERHSGGVRLNEHGECLKIACSRAFSILEDECFRVRNQGQDKRITIGCSTTFLAHWLLPRIELFSGKNPIPQLTFQNRTDVNAVLTGKVDVIILSQSNHPSDEFKVIPLMADVIGPVCSPKMKKMMRTPGDATKVPLLHASSRLNAWAEWATAVNIGNDVSRGRSFDTLSLTIEAAKGALGFAMTPEFLVRNDIENGTLVAPVGFTKVERMTWIYLDPKKQSDPEVMSFVEWLLSETATENLTNN